MVRRLLPPAGLGRQLGLATKSATHVLFRQDLALGSNILGQGWKRSSDQLFFSQNTFSALSKMLRLASAGV
jgi:hypothetical protein